MESIIITHETLSEQLASWTQERWIKVLEKNPELFEYPYQRETLLMHFYYLRHKNLLMLAATQGRLHSHVAPGTNVIAKLVESHQDTFLAQLIQATPDPESLLVLGRAQDDLLYLCLENNLMLSANQLLNKKCAVSELALRSLLESGNFSLLKILNDYSPPVALPHQATQYALSDLTMSSMKFILLRDYDSRKLCMNPYKIAIEESQDEQLQWLFNQKTSLLEWVDPCTEHDLFTLAVHCKSPLRIFEVLTTALTATENMRLELVSYFAKHPDPKFLNLLSPLNTSELASACLAHLRHPWSDTTLYLISLGAFECSPNKQLVSVALLSSLYQHAQNSQVMESSIFYVLSLSDKFETFSTFIKEQTPTYQTERTIHHYFELLFLIDKDQEIHSANTPRSVQYARAIEEKRSIEYLLVSQEQMKLKIKTPGTEHEAMRI